MDRGGAGINNTHNTEYNTQLIAPQAAHPCELFILYSILQLLLSLLLCRANPKGSDCSLEKVSSYCLLALRGIAAAAGGDSLVIAVACCWSCFSRQSHVPSDTIRWPNVELLLGHRLRRWPNINPTMVVHQRTVLYQGIETAFVKLCMEAAQEYI